MFNSQRHKIFLSLKGIIVPSPTPKCYSLLRQYLPPFSLKFSTSTSAEHSFAVSYLLNSCGFSREDALKAFNSRRVRFKTSQKPDAVLASFRNRGFSDSEIHSIIRKEPRILSSNLDKSVWPKIEFLLSKGASLSDIVHMVITSPHFLTRSLENHIIPSYELLKRFFLSDKLIIGCMTFCTGFSSSDTVAVNVKMLLDKGVTESNIRSLFRAWPSLFCSKDLGKTVEEVKNLGFDPSKSRFSPALVAKVTVGKEKWDAKVDTYKSWGWSEEAILEAFRRQPTCMLRSIDKINSVMRFWVNQLGWNSLMIVKRPEILGFSLKRRILPRAMVLQFLLSKGLINQNSSLFTPFTLTDKLFLQKYVERFEEETSQLLKLYEEKTNLQSNREKTGI